MDDLFRRANKYSMLKDDVWAATQQVMVAGQASRGAAERNAKLPDRPKPSDRRQEGPSRPERPPLTPLSISYEKLLPMIQDMTDFRWPRPLGTDPSRRDHSKKYVFHKEHGHTTETCRCLYYLVERLIKAGHLKQYLRSDARGRDASRNHNFEAPKAPAAPKAVINDINGGPSDEEYDSKRKRQKLLRAAWGTVSQATWGTVSQASKILGEFCPDSTGRQLLPWEILYCWSKLAQSLSTYNFWWYKIYHPSMSSWGAHGYTT